jgi:sucrose-6-phosphate hydrolase SacC (GH32 family)
MLHWEWHKTKLQPSFTGHGMFSGTGFITKEGRPAAIYHGQRSNRNQIVIAKNNALSEWEKPYPVEVKTKDGKEAEINHWDPDCFLIGDTYYAISGGKNPPLFKSDDLKNWTLTGDFLQHEMPDVALGEDISCANFFKIDNKWMLLCISHRFGCRYYLGDWDEENEQFVPTSHERMNWLADGQSDMEYRNFFAPESVLTPDGRRIMWAWLASLDTKLDHLSLQSLPRELSLDGDGTLRIEPLRELKSLRYAEESYNNFEVGLKQRHHGGYALKKVTKLEGDAFEIEAVISREEAQNKQFGLRLFSNGKKDSGFPVVINPVTKSIRVGKTEASFIVDDLLVGEDVNVRIFIDKYLVEVFVNGRQAVVEAYMDYDKKSGVYGYTFGSTTTFKEINIWKMKTTNEGYYKAKESRIWEPDRK